MPNWCEGVLKLRGNKDNLIKFVFDNLIVIKKDGKYPLCENYDMTDFELCIDKRKQDVWFKDSRRLFLTGNIDWWFEKPLHSREEEIYIQCLDIKQAWDIDADYWMKVSQDYDLDVSLVAFEKGMCFSREILIENKELKRNVQKSYDSWKGYCWDVYDPRLGG